MDNHTGISALEAKGGEKTSAGLLIVTVNENIAYFFRENYRNIRQDMIN